MNWLSENVAVLVGAVVSITTGFLGFAARGRKDKLKENDQLLERQRQLQAETNEFMEDQQKFRQEIMADNKEMKEEIQNLRREYLAAQERSNLLGQEVADWRSKYFELETLWKEKYDILEKEWQEKYTHMELDWQGRYSALQEQFNALREQTQGR